MQPEEQVPLIVPGQAEIILLGCKAGAARAARDAARDHYEMLVKTVNHYIRMRNEAAAVLRTAEARLEAANAAYDARAPEFYGPGKAR